MNVLLSIKPEFAEKILKGEKGYEFRKTRFRSPSDVETVYMYASSPRQRIVGWFTFDRVVEDAPETLWDRYGPDSGIQDKQTFMEYFGDSQIGYAIEIENVQALSDPVDPKQNADDFRPPVSYQYVNEEPDFLSEEQYRCPRSSCD